MEKPNEYLKGGIQPGGKEISKMKDRNWVDMVGCISDLNGHLISFVKKDNNFK